MVAFQSLESWIIFFQIAWINVILSADNAIVIAMAAQALPRQQQKRAIMIGAAAAVLFRVVLTVGALSLLELPYARLLGGALLLWIGVQLFVGQRPGDGVVAGSGTLGAAIRAILVADLVMSMDNVIAVAALAKGSVGLVIVGLAVSIPLVSAGAMMIVRLLARYPWIAWVGAGLIGWVAGETISNEKFVADLISSPLASSLAAPAGALIVLVVGWWQLARRRRAGSDPRHRQP